MATHRIPILGFATRPDDSGEAFFEPEDLNFGTNDLAKQFVLALGSALAAQPTVKHGVYGAFEVPKNYVGTAVVGIIWAATLTTGDVVFDFDYRAITDDESLDPSTWQESVTATKTADATARERDTVTINLTGTNFAVDDTVLFFLGRDGADANDTMAGRAYVFGAFLQYADA
jgi:hypothetical protein